MSWNLTARDLGHPAGLAELASLQAGCGVRSHGAKARATRRGAGVWDGDFPGFSLRWRFGFALGYFRATPDGAFLRGPGGWLGFCNPTLGAKNAPRMGHPASKKRPATLRYLLPPAP
jgi:hypothetical protein